MSFQRLILLTTIILGGVFLTPSDTFAINSVCKDPRQYEASLNITPVRGGVNSNIAVTATFRWLTDNPVCLNNKLILDLGYEYKLSGVEQITEEKVGALPRFRPAVLSRTMLLSDLPIIQTDPTLRDGNVFTFLFNVESDDISDFGDDLFPQALKKDYTITDPSVTPRTTNPSFAPNTPGPVGREVTFNFEIKNPLKINSFLDFITTITVWLTNIAIPVAVIFIVYAGVLFLTAGAVPANVSKARSILTYVVIGLSIILIGRGFITLIESVLNLGGSASPTPTASVSVSPSPGSTVSPSPTNTSSPGGLGAACIRQDDCREPFHCGSRDICQRSDGNLRNEPCYGAPNCASGLSCLGADVGNKKLGTCQ